MSIPTSQRKRILCVDDDPVILMTMRFLFAHKPVDFASVADGREAVRKVFSWNPDLVFLDLNMPLLNGYDVLDVLNPLVEYEKLEIIVISVENRSAQIQLAHKKGASGFLTKPLNPGKLLEIIDKVSAARTSTEGW